MAKKPEPPPPTRWDVCKVTDKSLRLGTVEAADKRAPIEKAAIEFKTDIWRLYGLPRR
jgi:hypothetical protein